MYAKSQDRYIMINKCKPFFNTHSGNIDRPTFYIWLLNDYIITVKIHITMIMITNLNTCYKHKDKHMHIKVYNMNAHVCIRVLLLHLT